MQRKDKAYQIVVIIMQQQIQKNVNLSNSISISDKRALKIYNIVIVTCLKRFIFIFYLENEIYEDFFNFIFQTTKIKGFAYYNKPKIQRINN